MAYKNLKVILSPIFLSIFLTLIFMSLPHLAQGFEGLRGGFPIRYPALDLRYRDFQDVGTCSQKSESKGIGLTDGSIFINEGDDSCHTNQQKPYNKNTWDFDMAEMWRG